MGQFGYAKGSVLIADEMPFQASKILKQSLLLKVEIVSWQFLTHFFGPVNAEWG